MRRGRGAQKPYANDIEQMRLGMVGQPVLAILHLTVLSIRDGPHPAAAIHAQAREATRACFV